MSNYIETVINTEGELILKVLVLFYSTYGHLYQMALAAAEGAKEAGAEVTVKRVPETLSAGSY